MLTLSRIRSCAIGFVTLALLVGLVYVTQIPAASQTPPSAPVTIVNTPANSVPVTQQGTSTISGSVSITGTPTVNVGNLPATQPVSGTVNVGNFPPTQPVSGTVDIGNLPAAEPIGKSDSFRSTLHAQTQVNHTTPVRNASVITVWSDGFVTVDIVSPAGIFSIPLHNQNVVVPLPQKLPICQPPLSTCGVITGNIISNVITECNNAIVDIFVGTLSDDCHVFMTIAGD